MRRAGGKLLLLALTLAAPAADKRPITAELAAKDPAEWAGLIPDQVAWAPDGKCFYYHAGNHKLNHPDQNAVFEVPGEGGAPRRLSESERLALPPLDALDPDPERRNYSRDRRLFVYANRGDVFLTDTASGRTRRLTNTDAEETAAHFSHDDRYVLFEAGQNLFGWTVETGELRQFTRFRVGKDPERKPETDFQKFLEKQQLELFATVREAEQERERQKKDLAADSGINLTIQTRSRETGRAIVTSERIDPTKTGVVIIDMWNTNDCMTNAQRCAALAPRMNKALEGARRLGMQIIWAPTDVASQYAGTPQRERAIALPRFPLPHVRDYSCPFSVPTQRPGKCMCGPGIVCHLHYGWDRMDPNLMIAAGDWIVGDPE